MPNLVNQMIVRQLKDELKESAGMVLVSFGGLDVLLTEDVRSKLAEKGASLHMVRNKLLRRVLDEQGIQFAVAGLCVIGPAHDSNHLRPYTGIAFSRFDPVGHGIDHAGRVQVVVLAHEPGAEPQLNVIDTLAPRIFHIFISYPPTGIQIMQNRGQVAEPTDKVHQTIGLAFNHDVRAQRLDIVCRQSNPLLLCQLDNGLQADTAVQVAVQVD